MMGKVKVTTKCGEEHFYDFDQEVESVEIIKEERGADLFDDKGNYIFATVLLGISEEYYIEKKEDGVFSLFNADGGEIGFFGRKYGKNARLRDEP